nr:HypC/HybG/HupF family hydrogenase formation chaperone [uncultured Dethiosulfovibrio sp.]
MCLAIPHRIEEILEDNRATARAGSVVREIRTDFIGSPEPGEDVLVHGGFAIQRISPEDGEELNELWGKIRDLAGEI